ncbi:TonB-dependent receptor plug domain-containing protein [Nisaea sp.]|uniref:TonB-dependent receptor plug domain-containing protein n=1 Tax=Nisaea sp. TaxID=2024842 RepID=UPI003B520E4E
MSKKLNSLVLATLLSSAALTSADAKDLDYLSFQELFGEPVTVGATGTPQRASEVPVNMTILTAEDIKRSAARNIPEVLRQIPGLSVRQNGFNSYDVGIRGYNQPLAERILVLIDGRQVYEDYWGLVSWDNLPVTLQEIKQIEVIKGPNTALYGFNATSGVINIITYNPRFDDYSGVSASAGNNDYVESNGTATWRNERGGIRVTASGFAGEEFDGDTGGASTALANDNPYNRFFKANGAYEIVDGVDMGLEITNSESTTNFMFPTNTSFNDASEQNWSAKFTVGAETDLGTIDVIAYRNQSDAEVANTSEIKLGTTTDFVQISDTFKVGTDHIFRIAGEYRHVSSNGAFDPQEISYDVLTSSGLWNWTINEQLSWSNAVRADFLSLSRQDGNQAYNRDLTAVSINSGLVYKVTPLDTLRLTYARAVDLPSVVEFGQAPSSDISTVNNFGVDYAHTFQELQTTATVGMFYQTIEDMQEIVVSIGEPNPLDSDAYGFELGLNGTIDGGWDWGLGYAYVSTDDSAKGTIDPAVNLSYEDSQSENIFTAQLGYTYDKWTVDLYGNYMSGYTPYNLSGSDVDDVLLGSIKVNYEVITDVNLSLTGMSTLTGTDPQSAAYEVEDLIFASVTVKF